MQTSTKKQTFLHGAALLAGAAALVKALGALYKIPLNAILGAQGFGYFNTAYQIYSVLLLVSTAGLPVAMSRMISHASALGRFSQVRQVYRVARGVFLTLGALCAGLMVLFCRELAAFVHQSDTWAAIACLGPCAFFVCLISVYRGFFQGQGNMRPTAISEVIEAVCKLLCGVSAATLIYDATRSLAFAAAGAILGVVLGCVVSAAYLGIVRRRENAALTRTHDTPEAPGKVLKQLLAIAVPITVGSAGVQSMYFLEINLFMRQLLRFHTQQQADTLKGIYDMALTVYNMPGALVTPITVSIIPAVAAHLACGNNRGARASEESAARIMALIAMPCAVGLAVLGEPIMAMLGGYGEAEAAVAGRCLSVLGAALFFHATTQLTNAILQSHGYASVPVVHILLAGLTELAAVYILAGNERIGIVGVGLGAIVCNVCVSALNLIAIYRRVETAPALVRNFLRPAPASALMGAAAYMTWRLVRGAAEGRVLPCAVPIAVGVLVYLPAVVLTRCVKREDCLLLPKGEKLAKLLCR